jgi:lipoyl-dependent peroxiredoxin
MQREIMTGGWNGMLRRRGEARWRGTGLEGSGALDTPSGALRGQPYSVHTRFESEDGRAGTNPEELIAAAHAGCFTMAFSFQLGGAGYPPEELHTEAVISMESEGVHWSITSVRLNVRGLVPGIADEEFRELAEAAKAGCPVSRALAVPVTVDARLAG